VRISDLARQAGVTVKAVRYYESLGLISPARLANGYRDYSPDEVRLVREIHALGRLGIAAARTRPFLDCLETGHQHADDCPSSLAGYRDAISDLTERIETLTARRAALTRRLHEAASRGTAIGTGDVDEADGCGLGLLPPGPSVSGDDGAADHLAGLRMPAITLGSTSGGTVTLDALGAARSILYLYPLTGRLDADLPDGWGTIPGARGCTAEARGFADHQVERTDLPPFAFDRA